MSALLLRHLAGDAKEEAVRELHDVRFVHGGHLAAAVPPRVVEGELDDAARAGDRDRLERDPGAFADTPLAVVLDPVDERGRVLGSLLELDPGVEVLGVLAHDDEVDARITGTHALVALARAHLAVEVEGLAERDVDASKARADRRRDWPLERDAVLLDRLQDVVGERVAAVLVHDVGPRLLHVPVEFDTGCVEDPARCLGKLGPGAVTGNEGHAMSHGRGVMVAGGR